MWDEADARESDHVLVQWQRFGTVEQFIVQEVVIFLSFSIENIQNCHKITINFFTNHTHNWQIRACIVRVQWSRPNACTLLSTTSSIIVYFWFDFLRLKWMKKSARTRTQQTKKIGYQFQKQ